jgi:hypothetical protein
MEGFWGMGSTVSSYSTAKRLEVGSPGGGAAGRRKKGQDPEVDLRRALADRIEDKLGDLLQRVETILTQDRGQVLCLAHALETYKTLSGEDVLAVIERTRGPLVDGRQYGQPGFTAELEEYHRAAMSAHREHSPLRLNMPALPPAAWVPEAIPAGPATAGPATATPATATPGAGPEPGTGPVLGS